jgi:O-antigen/teichoic acid export membrane protein
MGQPNIGQTLGPASDLQAAPSTSEARPRTSLASVVARLSAANWLLVAVGIITGPLLARALGPTGRGDVAAILVPLTFAPIVLNLGLGTYVTRETVRQRSLSVIAGSVGSMLIAIGGVAAIGGVFAAEIFSGGRPVVYGWILIGFLLMPAVMLSLFLLDVAVGLERWSTVMKVRVIPPTVSLLGILCLYLTHSLDVTSAAAVAVLGPLIATIPTLAIMRVIGKPVFRRAVATDALRFGSRAWLGGLGSLANVRLDQLLMTRLVAPRELGLYVVAVTLSSFFVSPFLSALTSGMLPRFADGDRELAGRLLRSTLAGVIVLGAGVAVVVPVVLPLVYGSSFSAATPMVWILIVGSIPLAGVNILSTVLTISGHPGFSAISELVAVMITVPLLIIFLPLYGGLGAAVVSAVAYSANFMILLVGSRRRLRLPLSELLFVRGEDLRLLLGIGRTMIRRRMSRPYGRSVRRPGVK